MPYTEKEMEEVALTSLTIGALYHDETKKMASELNRLLFSYGINWYDDDEQIKLDFGGK